MNEKQKAIFEAAVTLTAAMLQNSDTMKKFNETCVESKMIPEKAVVKMATEIYNEAEKI